MVKIIERKEISYLKEKYKEGERETLAGSVEHKIITLEKYDNEMTRIYSEMFEIARETAYFFLETREDFLSKREREYLFTYAKSDPKKATLGPSIPKFWSKTKKGKARRTAKQKKKETDLALRRWHKPIKTFSETELKVIRDYEMGIITEYPPEFIEKNQTFFWRKQCMKTLKEIILNVVQYATVHVLFIIRVRFLLIIFHQYVKHF